VHARLDGHRACGTLRRLPKTRDHRTWNSRSRLAIALLVVPVASRVPFKWLADIFVGEWSHVCECTYKTCLEMPLESSAPGRESICDVPRPPIDSVPVVAMLRG